MEYSEEFQPDEYSEGHQQQYRAPKKAAKYVSGAKNGVWSELQHTKYIVFMEHNKDKMRSKEKRRTNKLYKAMAQYIQTRNALQCRSHHQKLEQKFVYPNKIITNFKSHYDLTLYLELRRKLQRDERTTASTQTYELKLQEQDPQSYLAVEANPTQQPQYPSTHSNVSFSQLQSVLPIHADNPQLQYASWHYNMNQQWSPYYFYPCYTIY